MLERYYPNGDFSKRAQLGMQLGYFPNSISITGTSGVGSSSTVKELMRRLGKLPYRVASSGGAMRMRADGLGMSIEQFARHNKEHPEEGHDIWCENVAAIFGLQDYIILDGRLTHISSPRSFKVKLICPQDVCAKRRAADSDRDEGDILKEIIERDTDDRVRYMKLYPGCMWHNTDYDLVIDTSKHSIEEVGTTIIEQHALWLETSGTKPHLIPRLYATHPPHDVQLLKAA